MKIKELISELQQCSNQDADVWVCTGYAGNDKWAYKSVERVRHRWIRLEGRPYQEGDDDINLVLKDLCLD